MVFFDVFSSFKFFGLCTLVLVKNIGHASFKWIVVDGVVVDLTLWLFLMLLL